MLAGETVMMLPVAATTKFTVTAVLLAPDVIVTVPVWVFAAKLAAALFTLMLTVPGIVPDNADRLAQVSGDRVGRALERLLGDLRAIDADDVKAEPGGLKVGDANSDGRDRGVGGGGRDGTTAQEHEHG